MATPASPASICRGSREVTFQSRFRRARVPLARARSRFFMAISSNSQTFDDSLGSTLVFESVDSSEGTQFSTGISPVGTVVAITELPRVASVLQSGLAAHSLGLVPRFSVEVGFEPKRPCSLLLPQKRRRSITMHVTPPRESGIRRNACMNCGGSDLRLILDLGDQPNGNHFIDADEVGREPIYSMRMITCTDCWQVQIDEFPSQGVLFDDHPYVSGVNVPVIEHFETLAAKTVADFGLLNGSVVLDIGCNDGSLLSAFRRHGMTTIGVDPGQRVTDLAKQNGHLACRAFWNSETARSLKQLGVQPRVISATAVFYHVPDLHDFVDGLTTLMNDETVFVVQGVNLQDLIEKREFDHFYHEHSCIHSISGLDRLFSAHGMRLINVTNYEIHGGSFVAYV